MNLGLHGLFLQVIVSIVQFQHGFRLCRAGEPGYLDFDNLPETNFSCQGKVIGGYYADVEAGCQMFHVCTIGQKDEIMDIKFLCLNGTVFDQETRVCERVDEVDCSKSEKFYNLNLELYGNHAVTLSLHDSAIDEEDDPSDLIDEHESQRTTSPRPSTTSSTTTTTPRPIISSTTSASGPYQHPNGYPQHYQPQPRFPSVQTSQSKSLYDDKNGGYHHQYIYHTGDHRNNNLDNNNNDGNNNHNNNNNNDNHNSNSQATSYQLFSNQGISSTTGAPQIHQVRYSSTPTTQIQIHNDHQPTVSPIFHATSSTIQTLLNSNANSPALINPIFHNHGIASTTEQFAVHNNNPREADEYRDDDQGEQGDDNHEGRRPLEAIQPTTQGKVSKLAISPLAVQEQAERSGQHGKNVQQQQQQQQRITTSFLPTPSSEDGQNVRSFYPTPRTSTKSSSSHVTHIHLPPPPAIPQLKPHQITINLPTPDIQRIVQNPSPLLPSQSRVIVTAKASVSDESGRALNTTQLVTIPLPTIPASYDDYKEGDESFDPFYRDVPKIRNDRRAGGRFRWPVRDSREKRSQRTKRNVESEGNIEDIKVAEVIDVAGGNGTKKLEIVQVDDVKGGESQMENSERGDEVADKESKSKEEELKDADKLKTIEQSLKHHSDPEEKDEEKSLIEGKGLKTEEEEAHKDMEDLKTMSTKHHSDSEEIVDKKSAIDTRESDEEEYVDDVKSKSVVDSRETDTEEYVNVSAETFDSKIFEEPESQTSKEVDTRAVAQQDSKYSKDRANRFEKEEKNSKHDHANGLETTRRAPEEESSRFSLLPEVVSSRKSHRKHSTNNLRLKERVPAEEEEEDETEYEDEREEIVRQRKSHRRNSRKKLKSKERFPAEEDYEEEDDEEREFDRVVRPRKSHRKHSTKTSKLRQRDSVEIENDDEYEDEDETEEVVSPRKSHRKHSTKKSKLRERIPIEDEEEAEYEEELPVRPRKSHRKHSRKESKLNDRLPVDEEDEDEAQEREISYEKDFPENYDYYDSEIDDSSSGGNNGDDSAAYSKESPNKLKPSSRHHKSSRYSESSKFSDEAHREKSLNRRDKSRKFRDENEEEDDYDFADISTTQSNEDVTSVEMSGEYVDGFSMNTSTEDFHEIEDDHEPMLRDGGETRDSSSSELPREVSSTTEKIESPEVTTTDDDKNTRPDDKHMSEGVLKFTDEIPSSEGTVESIASIDNSKPADETSQDYIDDNYEPHSYKEHGESLTTTEVAEVITEKNEETEISTLPPEVEKRVEEISTTETPLMPVTVKEIMEEKQNDEPQLEKVSPEVELMMEKAIEKPNEPEETTSTTTSTTPSTTTSTTTSTTITTTTTTTARPTPPKLFKPFPLRKNYVYVPPTTTPVPVIIKPRLALLNPKPAKPPKSYNDLAPKPIIRKSPLYARKTTVRTTTPRIEVENHEMSTDLPVATTDSSLIEEQTSSTSTSTPVPTTETLQSSSEATATSPSLNEDRVTSSSNDEHVFFLTTEHSEVLSTTETPTFTPYPLLVKLAEDTAAMQKYLVQTEEPAKEDISTTVRADMESNNVPSIGEPEISTSTTTETLTTLVPEEASSEKPFSSSTEETQTTEMLTTEATSASSILPIDEATDKPESVVPVSTTIEAVTSEAATENSEVTTTLRDAIIKHTPTLASIRAVNRRPGALKRTDFFNCLEKEMYRFYADGRDCRLFHYCSPGFTSRQVLDFRFVCEEGTAFDEKSQSCIHDVMSPECQKRVW